MQKLFLIFLPFLIFLGACQSGNDSKPVSAFAPKDSTNIFPVTAFLKAQLKQLDTLPVTPLQIITSADKVDSTWLKREDIRRKAASFLTPEIDSIKMHSLYSEKSFLDQTINAFTFSYDPKKPLPDSIDLTHWDVYMNPQNNEIQRIYLVKQKDSGDISITKQLTWVVNKWFSIRTISQKKDDSTKVREEKLVWNFEN